MAVPDADPDAAELDKVFSAAMGAAPRPKEPGPPPEVDADAPHGRDGDGTPLAPYGFTKDGKVRRSPAGRKAKDPDAAARVADAVSQPPARDEAKSGPVLPPQDYTRALSEAGDGAWLMLAAASKLPLGRVPVVGRRLAGAEVKLKAQASLFRAHKDALAAGINLAAQHNARARRFAERLNQGDVTWVLVSGGMMLPFALQSAMLWRGGDAEMTSALAKQCDQEIDDFIASLVAMMAEAQDAAGVPAAPVPVNA